MKVEKLAVVALALVTTVSFGYDSGLHVKKTPDNVKLKVKKTEIRNVKINPKQKKLILKSKEVKIVDKRDNKILLTLTHTHSVSSAVFSKDRKTVLTSNCDRGEGSGGEVILWDSKNGKKLLLLKHNLANKAMFSKDEKKILSLNYGSKAKLWDIKTGKELHTLAHKHSIGSVVFSKDGKKILTSNYDALTGEGGEIILWDIKTAKKLLSLKHNMINGTIFSKDEKEILSWSSMGESENIMLWNTKSGKKLLSLDYEGVSKVEFNKDGTEIIANSYGEISYWDKKTGKKLPKK